MPASFDDFLEVVRAEEVAAYGLFGAEGPGAGRLNNSPEHLRRVAETATFLGDIRSGRLPVRRLREALSTSDFSYLFADTMNRMLLAEYEERPANWDMICARADQVDFRQGRMVSFDGADGLLAPVVEYEGYEADSLSDSQYPIQIGAYGKRIPISWRMMVNDDLDALLSIPAKLARGARRTEQYKVTALYVGATGPLGTFYTSGNKNIINTTNAGFGSVNPPLSIDGLRQAYAVLANQVDPGGMPIDIEGYILEVPPALEVTATELVNATAITVGADSEDRRLQTANWIKQRTRVKVNPFIPKIATTNGNTTWFLHADPKQASRPAFAFGYLKGHEGPRLFQKAGNQIAIGGGSAGPEDFDTDSIQYKVRSVFGVATVDPKYSVASNGSGS